MIISASALNGIVLIKLEGCGDFTLTLSETEQLVNELIDAMEDARGKYRAKNQSA